MQNLLCCLSAASLDSIEHGRSTRGLREGIASRIIIGLTDREVLDFAIYDVCGKTLAASNDTDRSRSGVGHLQVKSLGESTGGVAIEVDYGSFDALVLAPSRHNCPIVDTVNHDFVNPGFLKSVLVLKVSRDLGGGSRGGESAGKTDEDHVLSLNVVSNVDHVRGESGMDIDGRHLVTGLGGEGERRPKRGRGCRAQKSKGSEDSHGGYFLCQYTKSCDFGNILWCHSPSSNRQQFAKPSVNR